MVDQGNADKVIVGANFVLNQGSNAYILKKLTSLQLLRQKFRDGISSGPVISYGVGDHGLDATLELDTSQIANWVAFNLRDSSGALPNNPWSLVATPKDGTTPVTISFNGEVPEVEFSQTDPEGRVNAVIHLDITDDSVTVS